MRGYQTYRRKFHPKGEPSKFTDLSFIQAEEHQMFKNMISFFSGPKINPKSLIVGMPFHGMPPNLWT
jgi:hypothetical protein